MNPTDPAAKTPGSFLVLDAPGSFERAPARLPEDLADADAFLAARDAALAEGREIFIVALKGRHAQYLRDRARNHGETPERQLESILRQFQAHHDDRRPDQRPTLPEPGQGPVTRRA